MPDQFAANTDSHLLPRYLGPVGNRVSAVAGVPGNHLVYYAGSATGGIFKTIDGGTTWAAVFDAQAKGKPIVDAQGVVVGGEPERARVSSIGALAVSESDPNVVWAGTGESWMRGSVSIGNGIYKSTDGGVTWTHMGLEETGRFSKLVIHPTNPDIVWAAAVGSCYGPSDWRGVFKTADGGLTWKRVLHINQETGCSDLTLDANNPRVLYAGMWQFKLRSWIRVSGGPGSGLYKSTDGGETWDELTKGLPTENHAHPVGKISVGVARTDSNYVYASIETGDGEPTWDFPHPGNGQLFQSKDAGATWNVKSYQRSINSRAAYYTRNAVSTDNKHEVYFFSPNWVTTIDGGDNLSISFYPDAPGIDHHEGWIDPNNGDRMAVASDLGISITQNRGETWYKIELPNAQVYHVNVDDEVPYNVYGNCQDRDGMWGPSNARIPLSQGQDSAAVGRIPRGAWRFAGGGESGWSIPEPGTDYIYSSGGGTGPNGGIIALLNRQSGHWREITVNYDLYVGSAPQDDELRFHWAFPLHVSPHDRGGQPRRVYACSQFVHATDNRGQSWQIIPSPDLTGYDERFLRSSGGLTGDNLSVRTAYCLTAIAESPCRPDLLWVGTTNQRVWLGLPLEGGAEWEWTEFTADKFPELPVWDETQRPDDPTWGRVSCIAPSPHDAAKAYVTFDFHEANDFRPYIYKTTDSGRSWTKITAGISGSVLSFVHCVVEDPGCPGLLFAGTENALYVSYDDGGAWQPLPGPGLPPTPVTGLAVQEHFSDLVVATFGRGFYIFDDITPLRQHAAVADRDVYLFEMPRPFYRFQFIADAHSASPGNDPTAGDDPPSPGPINFYLKSSAEVTMTILDEHGDEVRKFDNLQGTAGINRVWWDLQSKSTQTIKLRTNPANQLGTLYCPDGTRPYQRFPVVGNSLTWLVAPGTYTVKLTVAGSEQTRRIVVKKDPTSCVSPEDLTRQIELSKNIWCALNAVAGDINVIEFVRFQLEQLRNWIENPPALDLIRRFDSDLLDIEHHLMQMKLTGEGEDLARFEPRLVEKLVNLGGMVGTGDYRPTDTQLDGYGKLRAEVDVLTGRLNALLQTVPQFNAALEALGVSGVLTTLPPDSGPPCALFGSGVAF